MPLEGLAAFREIFPMPLSKELTLNTLTAIGAHERQLFSKLLW